MEDSKIFVDLSEFYKIFADSTRLKILSFLISGEKCVGEISEKLGISQSATSHQLKTLRDSTLVKAKKAGQIVKYSIADDHIKIILQYGVEHIKEGVK